MLLLVLLACQNLPIEDGWRHQDLIQIKDGFTSVFLTLGDEPALIDAGFQTSGNRVSKALKNYDLTPKDIQHIFITHGHGDHLGGLEQYPNATLYALSDEQDLILETSGFAIDVGLEDAESIDLGEKSIQVFSVPGHTKGNAVYLTQEVLILGDSATAQKGNIVVPPPERFSDAPQKTAQAIVDLGARLSREQIKVEWLAFSHSGALKSLQPLLDYQIK